MLLTRSNKNITETKDEPQLVIQPTGITFNTYLVVSYGHFIMLNNYNFSTKIVYSMLLILLCSFLGKEANARALKIVENT